MIARALLVEDDSDAILPLAEVVRREGFTPHLAGSLEEARNSIRDETPRVVLLDLILPDGNGLDLLDDLKHRPRADVILMTGEPSLDSAVQAMRRDHVRDYLTKPLDLSRLRAHLVSILKDASQSANNKTTPEGRTLLGSSRAIRKVLKMIERVGPTDASVLVVGESGTGKELVARAVHEHSARSKGPFVAINCGAIPENLIESELFGHEKGAFTGAAKARKGVFEQATGGTLFLDEVTEMPIDLQVRLLRVLETNRIWRVGGERELEVDARIVAATNNVPAEAVQKGKLREDLLYRLAVFPIHVSPLREREGDIELLAKVFLEELNEANGTNKTFTPDVLNRLKEYPWPGNVRQLKNFLHHAHIISDDEIELDEFPQSLTTSIQKTSSANTIAVTVGVSLADAERQVLLATLEHFHGDKDRTAQVLGISLKTVYNRLNKYKEELSPGSAS